MIERTPFGRTGHLSSRVIFGAAALYAVGQDVADEVLSILLEFGVNHIDTAALYGDSELRIAPWMPTHRNDFFLATKTHERHGSDARASLERSLERLGVDHVDLIQLHNLVEPDEWEVAHAKGGAVEALVKARDEGLTRFIGTTGHGTRIARMHIRSLERFDYDSVLFPYNFAMLANEHYRLDVEELLSLCQERNVAVQTIKSLARRRWSDTPAAPGERLSWYEPLADPVALRHAVEFVLGRDQLFLNSSSDYRLLRSTLETAAAPTAIPSEDEMASDLAASEVQALFNGTNLERM